MTPVEMTESAARAFQARVHGVKVAAVVCTLEGHRIKIFDAGELPRYLCSSHRLDPPEDRREPTRTQGHFSTWQRDEGKDAPSRLPTLPARPPRPAVHGIAEGEGAPSPGSDGERSGVAPLRWGGAAVRLPGQRIQAEPQALGLTDRVPA